MKWHMDHTHPTIEITESANVSDKNVDNTATKRKSTVPLWKFRNKQERVEMCRATIPGWTPPKTMLPRDSPRAQSIHKSVFEEMILDNVPFSEVDKPGYLRHHAIVCPEFELASAKHYA